MRLVMGEYLQQQPGIHSFASEKEHEGCGCDPQHRDVYVHMTLDLLRRNHQLQQKLNLLQAETHAFLDSLLLHVPPDQAEE